MRERRRKLKLKIFRAQRSEENCSQRDIPRRNDAMDDTAAIEAEDLRKRCGVRQALEGVGVSVAAGEMVGLLGPNGAGKTSTLSILAGVLQPDSGRVRLCGHDLFAAPVAARRSLGLVPQALGLYPTLTAIENLFFFGRIQGLSAGAARAAALALLDEVGLADRAQDVAATFSGGMKRPFNLACGMVHEPPVLLLDEPTAGADPHSRERIFAVVKAAAERGAAVLYSTNYMEDAERLCDRVIVIDHGRIAAAGTPAQLIELAGAEFRVELLTRSAMAAGWSSGLAGVREIPSASNGGSLVSAALWSSFISIRPTCRTHSSLLPATGCATQPERSEALMLR
jgi:ABC-2 type transport system ATP-binding protein